MASIWGLILAAGESKRMGFPKMMLSFDGKTMIEKVIGNVKGSEVDDIVVVLGAYNEDLAMIVGKKSVRCCYNDSYKQGMLSSVICGIKYLPSEWEAVLVFQGDQPLISPVTINKVIGAYRLSDRGIVMPVYKGKRGHPLLIDRKYRDEIYRLDASEGLRSLAYRYSGDILEVETDDPGILRDFDTYEEYMEEINQKT